MIVTAHVAPPLPPLDAIVLPCAHLFLKVRIVECHLHRGVAGVRVTLARADREPVSADTDAHGRATFRFTSARIQAPVALRLAATMPPGGQYEPLVPAVDWPVEMRQGSFTEVTLTLRSHWVTPPGDLDARVTRALTNGDIRVWVDDGANFGNQAATLDFLRALRRLVGTLHPDPAPIARVLAKAGDYEEYTHSIKLSVTQAALVTDLRRTAFWAAFFHQLLPGIVLVAGEDDDGYRLDAHATEATLTLNRACVLVDADGEEARVYETTHAHIRSALSVVRTHATATALSVARMTLTSDDGESEIAGPFQAITLTVTDSDGQEATHTITLFVADLAVVTPPRLQTFWRRIAGALHADLAEAAENEPGYHLSDDGLTASVTLDHALDFVTIGDDDYQYAEAGNGHVTALLSANLADASTTALGVTKLRLVSSDGGSLMIGEPAVVERVLELHVRTTEEPSPAARLRQLEPHLADVYEHASMVGDLDAFDENARENVIGVVAAADIGNIEGAVTQGQVRGFGPKVGATEAIVLQPYLWYTTSRYVVGDQLILDLCLPKQASFVYDVAEAGVDAFAPLVADVRREAFLRALLAAKDANRVRLQVGYGLHQTDHPARVGRNLATALATLGAPKVVLLVPCKRPEFALGAAAVANAQVIDLDAAVDLAAALEAAIVNAEKTVIVATMRGALRTAVFHQLVRRSQLPVLFEGANTASLLINLGRPHLSVKVGTTTYATVPNNAAPATLTTLTGLLAADPLSGGNRDRLAAFLRDAAAGTSEVADYFTLAQQHLHRDELDQLKLALYRLDLERVPVDAVLPGAPVETHADALVT